MMLGTPLFSIHSSTPVKCTLPKLAELCMEAPLLTLFRNTAVLLAKLLELLEVGLDQVLDPAEVTAVAAVLVELSRLLQLLRLVLSVSTLLAEDLL
mmetsp:Transcript_50013/g.132941  ORF Transcript_50013/g.132941 Transcript_50013/m.132941 type:complete len:96 (+) Transcript_50013:504-791(+)